MPLTKNDSKKQFIDQLVSEHKPTGKLVKPEYRAIFWFVSLGLLAAGLMSLFQSFRPNFIEHLSSIPRFQIEIGTGLLLSGFLIYRAMIRVIPGRKVPKWLQMGTLITAVILVLSIILSFFSHPPGDLSLGARPLCEVEVIVYGVIGFFGLMIFLKKGMVPLSFWENVLIGTSVGLVPAVLMQAACQIRPLHAVFFHFLPAFLVGLASAWFVNQWHKKKRPGTHK